jgi:hypothetical protein
MVRRRVTRFHYVAPGKKEYTNCNGAIVEKVNGPENNKKKIIGIP